MSDLEQAKLILNDIQCGLRIEKITLDECGIIVRAIKSLEQENSFLKQIYSQTEEFERIKKLANKKI